jgi:hypothetical protein
LDLAQQAIEDVAPMGEHIEDQPTAGCLAVIPARALRRVEAAVEHPPAEIEPDRQNAAKELGLVKLAQFCQPGQEQLVLYDAALQAGAMRAARQIQCVLESFGDRLFEIDVLSRRERSTGARRPPTGGCRIEIDRDIGVREGRVPIGAPFEAAMRRRQSGELCRVAAEQYRLGHQTVAIGERQPASTANSQQRAQMLSGAEASSGPVDNDANRA